MQRWKMAELRRRGQLGRAEQEMGELSSEMDCSTDFRSFRKWSSTARFSTSCWPRLRRRKPIQTVEPFCPFLRRLSFPTTIDRCRLQPSLIPSCSRRCCPSSYAAWLPTFRTFPLSFWVLGTAEVFRPTLCTSCEATRQGRRRLTGSPREFRRLGSCLRSN